jgi:hypothetical protein
MIGSGPDFPTVNPESDEKLVTFLPSGGIIEEGR